MVALLLASGAMMLALPVALRGLIDKGHGRGQPATINGYFIAFLGVAAVLFGAFAALRYHAGHLARQARRRRHPGAVYRKVVRMDPQFFEARRR